MSWAALVDINLSFPFGLGESERASRGVYSDDSSSSGSSGRVKGDEMDYNSMVLIHLDFFFFLLFPLTNNIDLLY